MNARSVIEAETPKRALQAVKDRQDTSDLGCEFYNRQHVWKKVGTSGPRHVMRCQHCGKRAFFLTMPEAETPKGVFKSGLPRNWSVNFIKRSSRPWEQAIYNIKAVSEEEAIEKGWARLKEEVPKRWQIFRLYSCDKV